MPIDSLLEGIFTLSYVENLELMSCSAVVAGSCSLKLGVHVSASDGSDACYYRS